MWFSLAAAQGDEESKENRNKLVTEMSQDQIAESQRRARQWMDKHGNAE